VLCAGGATISPRHYLLIRRHITSGELAFHYCHVPDGQPLSLSRLIRAAGLAILRLTTYDVRMSTSMTEMREPTYYLLASLLVGPLHGYAIIKRTAELSRGRVHMATGTLYTALDRLTAEGYVRPVREEIVNGRARRTYGLTESGEAALRAEAIRMAEASSLVTARRRGPQARAATLQARPA